MPTKKAYVRSVCCVCGLRNTKLKCCEACKSVLYCSEECQKKDWPDHKKMCKYAKMYSKTDTFLKSQVSNVFSMLGILYGVKPEIFSSQIFPYDVLFNLQGCVFVENPNSSETTTLHTDKKLIQFSFLLCDIDYKPVMCGEYFYIIKLSLIRSDIEKRSKKDGWLGFFKRDKININEFIDDFNCMSSESFTKKKREI